MFVATNSQNKTEKNYRNPERALIRYKFMEILVRIAGDKYIYHNKFCGKYSMAFRLMLENGLKKKL